MPIEQLEQACAANSFSIESYTSQDPDPRTGAPYLRELGTKLMTRDIPGHRAAGSAAAGDPAEGDL